MCTTPMAINVHPRGMKHALLAINVGMPLAKGIIPTCADFDHTPAIVAEQNLMSDDATHLNANQQVL